MSIASWQAGNGARGGISFARPSLEELVLRLGDEQQHGVGPSADDHPQAAPGRRAS